MARAVTRNVDINTQSGYRSRDGKQKAENMKQKAEREASYNTEANKPNQNITLQNSVGVSCMRDGDIEQGCCGQVDMYSFRSRKGFKFDGRVVR
jgi:hypothetical protein